MSTIQRFTAYRRALSARGTHTEVQANPDDAPQYEGVVFSDGTCVLKWLTKANSVSVFATLEQMLSVHGHPEYGTEIVWHDGPMPEEWKHQLVQYADCLQHGYQANGHTDVTLVVETDEGNNLKLLLLKNMDESIYRVVYPVTIDG